MTTPIIWLSDYLRATGTNTPINEIEPEQKTNIRELILGVSSLIEDECGRRFDPYYATRFYSPYNIDRGGDVTEGGYLLLDDDLYSLSQLINNSVVTVDPADYALFPLESSTPTKDMIKLKNNNFWQGSHTIDNFDAIQVTGLWGGKGGSFKSKTSLTGDIDDSQGTIPVDSFSGLELGQVLRVDSELMLLENDPGSKTLRVERGYNGSTPAEHLTNARVSLWRAGDSVRRLANRMVKWQAALDDNPLIALVTIGDSQEPIDLSAAPADVAGMISQLTRPDRIRGV